MHTAKEIISDIQRKVAIPRVENDCCDKCGSIDLADSPRDDNCTDCEPEYVKCEDCGNVMFII